MVKDQKAKEQVQKENQEALKASQEAVEEDEQDAESDEEKPEGIVQPKYKIVHSYPVDMMDSWEGHKDAVEGASFKKYRELPTELTVTINLKYIDSIKKAKLDINDSTLVFEYPDIYYLDINLMYKVDKDAGTAKFDKTRKTLTIRVPVIDSTDDSAKVLEQHFRDYKEREEQRKKDLVRLQESRLADEAKKATEDAENEDPQTDVAS